MFRFHPEDHKIFRNVHLSINYCEAIVGTRPFDADDPEQNRACLKRGREILLAEMGLPTEALNSATEARRATDRWTS